MKKNVNPLLKMDYPDPDVIRVDDTFYMVSTTMYFMPGCEILRSCDLVHWEHAAYVYDTLDRLIYLDWVLAQVMSREDTDIRLE